jgi:hypothetical protein
MTDANELRRLRRWARACHFTIERNADDTGWMVVDPLSGGIVGKRKLVDTGAVSLVDIERILARRLKAAGLFGKRQRRLTA